MSYFYKKIAQIWSWLPSLGKWCISALRSRLEELEGIIKFLRLDIVYTLEGIQYHWLAFQLAARNFFFLTLSHALDFQTHSHGEVGKLPSDPYSGHIHVISNPSHFMPQSSCSSLSHLGQPPAQRFNHGRPTSTFSRGSDWHITVQPPNPSFDCEGPHSPGSGSFINGISWGTSNNAC